MRHAMAPPPVRLDGSQGEGGGQILRTGLFLSVLLQRAVHVEHVRAGRPEPGLKPQHVAILRLLGAVTGARIEGADVGSASVTFEPRPPRPGEYDYDVGTAGSLPLVLQTMLPVALLSPGPLRLRLTGGTDVAWGPTIDWVDHVLGSRLRPIAPRLELRVLRRGFFPKGGGLVELTTPGRPGSTDLAAHVRELLGRDRTRPGHWVRLEGTSLAHVSLEKAHVAERQAEAARAWLGSRGLPPPEIQSRYVDALSPGTSLTLWATDESGNVVGADGLGAPGLPAERVGQDVAARLAEDLASGATVDRHLADHLVPWIALGAGAVRVPHVTDHLTTNIAVCRAFLGDNAVALQGLLLVPQTPAQA
jgi:RNA 3'-terminal phosphate cyclase (ATP)